MQRMSFGASISTQLQVNLTTFNKHKGYYWFLHMPFGLKISQDVFQMRMDQITDRLPGIIAIHDDICVYGKDIIEHDHNLLQLMNTAQDQALVFNSSKCAICQSQISFYGAIFYSTGHETGSCKGTSFARPSCPTKSNATPVILRLNQLLAAFLPSLTSKTTFLREQVTNWDWNPSIDQAFNCLKSWVCNMLLKTTLAYYDCTAPHPTNQCQQIWP